MRRFKSPSSAQRFFNLYSVTYNSFYFQRHLIDRPTFKHYRSQAFESWMDASSAA